MADRWAERMSDERFAVDERRRRADRESIRRDEPGVQVRNRQTVRRLYSTLDGRATRILHSTRSRAKKRGISFDLTKEWVFEKLSAARCEVSGVAFDFDVDGRRNPFAPSIDRKNPRKGYTIDNCQMIVFSLNAAFGNWGEDSFLVIAKAFVAAKSKL